MMTIFNLTMMKSIGGVCSRVINTSEFMSCDFSNKYSVFDFRPVYIAEK